MAEKPAGDTLLLTRPECMLDIRTRSGVLTEGS